MFPNATKENAFGNSISYRFLNAIRENAFRNPAEPDDFLAAAKKPQVRMSNFWGNSISYMFPNISEIHDEMKGNDYEEKNYDPGSIHDCIGFNHVCYHRFHDSMGSFRTYITKPDTDHRYLHF